MRSFIILTVCISAFLITGADQAYPQDAWNMELIGKAAYDGYLRNYAAYNDHLFVISSKYSARYPDIQVLSVIDMSDPAHPRKIRNVYEGEPRIWELLIVETLLYVALDNGGVIIYDVQDPSLPAELANFDEDRGFGFALKGFGDFIGSMRQRSFHIIDISDRLNPQLVSSIERDHFDIYDFDVFGDHLLLVNGFEAIQEFYLDIYDISDLSNPTNVSFTSIEPFGYYAKSSVLGDYVYIYNSQIGIRIYDIREPGQPEFIDTVLEAFRIPHIEISGNVVFAANWDNSILTIDISDPLSPVITNELEVQSVRCYFRDVLSLTGDKLYYVAAEDVISLLNIADPDSPQHLGRYFPGVNTWERVAKWDNYLYIGDWDAGLRIVDISDPTEPVGVNGRFSYASNYFPFVYNGLLFFTGSYDGVQIFSLDDPLNPELLSTAAVEGNMHKIFVSEDYLYIPVRIGFSIIDVSDPANPYEVSNYEADDWNSNTVFWSISVSGDYAYTGESDLGVGIYDITDRANPVKVATYETPHAHTVFINDHILYVTGNNELLLLDVSNPAIPSFLGTAQIERSYDVFVEDNIAYVAAVDTNFQAFDVSDPYSPELVGTYNDYGSPTGVYVENDTVYVSALNGGVWILKYDEAVGIEDISAKPREFQLDQNYPNPFNAKTVLNYSLPESGVVTLSIYNILGQQVMTLFVGEKAAGKHTIAWDASDFPSGVYFARLETQDVSKTIKMVLLK